MKSPQIVDIEAPEVIEQEPEIPVVKGKMTKSEKKLLDTMKLASKVVLKEDLPLLKALHKSDSEKPELPVQQVKSKVENVFPFGDCLVPDIPKPEAKFETSELVFKDKDLDMTISNNLPAILKAKKLLEVYEDELRPFGIPVEKLNVTPKIYKPSENIGELDREQMENVAIAFDKGVKMGMQEAKSNEPKVPVPMPEVPKKTLIKKVWGLLPFTKKKPEVHIAEPIQKEVVSERQKDMNNEIILTNCPLCKNELKKEWIRQEGENFKQKMICKDCKFEKEYIFSI